MKNTLILLAIILFPLVSNAGKPIAEEPSVSIGFPLTAIHPYYINQAMGICKLAFGPNAYMATTEEYFNAVSEWTTDHLIPVTEGVGFVIRITELNGSDANSAFDIYSGSKGTKGVTCSVPYHTLDHFSECDTNLIYSPICAY